MSARKTELAEEALNVPPTDDESLPDFIAYDESFESAPDDQALKTIAELGETYLAKVRELDLKIADVDHLTEVVKNLAEQTIPDQLQLLHLSAFTCSDGTEITVKPMVAASITEKYRTEAHKWLRDQGHGDIIKNTITVTLGKGDDQKAKEIQDWLTTNGHGDKVSTKEAVHASTLKAFVREQDEHSKPVPEKIFGIYRVSRAVIIGRK